MLHVVVAALGALACFVAVGGLESAHGWFFALFYYFLGHVPMMLICCLDGQAGRTGNIWRFLAFVTLSACFFVNARIFGAMRWLGADREMVWALAALAGVLMASQIGAVARYVVQRFPELEEGLLRPGRTMQEVGRDAALMWIGMVVLLAMPWLHPRKVFMRFPT